MAQADLDRLDEHLRLCERLLEHEAELAAAQAALVERQRSPSPAGPAPLNDYVLACMHMHARTHTVHSRSAAGD
jgi:hypothetical protein